MEVILLPAILYRPIPTERHRYTLCNRTALHLQLLCLPVFSPSDGSIERHSLSRCLHSHDNTISLHFFAVLFLGTVNWSEPLLSYVVNQKVWSSPLKSEVTWEKHLSWSPGIHSALSARAPVICYIFAGFLAAQDQGTKTSPISRAGTQETSVFWACGHKALEIIELPSG